MTPTPLCVFLCTRCTHSPRTHAVLSIHGSIPPPLFGARITQVIFDRLNRRIGFRAADCTLDAASGQEAAALGASLPPQLRINASAAAAAAAAATAVAAAEMARACAAPQRGVVQAALAVLVRLREGTARSSGWVVGAWGGGTEWLLLASCLLSGALLSVALLEGWRCVCMRLRAVPI